MKLDQDKLKRAEFTAHRVLENERLVTSGETTVRAHPVTVQLAEAFLMQSELIEQQSRALLEAKNALIMCDELFEKKKMPIAQIVTGGWLSTYCDLVEEK